MIKVVTLDLDGVYFLNSHKNFKENLKKVFGLDEGKVVAVYFKSEMMKQYKLGKINGDEFWPWAIKEWGIDTTKKELLKILADGYSVNPEAKKLVDDLHKNGIKIALCTNNFFERISVVDDKLNFLPDFDIRVFSYEVGSIKPDLNIFQTLVEKTQVKPEEIIYFDDSKEAVDSAKKVGITAFLYEDFSQMLIKLKEQGLKV
jgi:epoxide hydrolase-like predicted phosphatase